MESYLETAGRLAREAHRGQVEESTGDDYIHHVERVVALVEGPDAQAVAWLHDVLEDSSLRARDLQTAGIPLRLIHAVLLLTRSPEETYADYIEALRASGDPLALAVKIADLRDHFRPNCPPRLLPRYQQAWLALTGGTPRPTSYMNGNP